MANRFLGEVVRRIDGRPYTLRCDMNALCLIEDRTGRPAFQVIDGLSRGAITVTEMRVLAWAMLQHHHGEVTLERAGELLSADTGMIDAALRAAMPEAETGGASPGEAAPGKPEARPPGRD